MSKHGIVILQDKEQKCEEIKKAFDESQEFKVVGTATDGEEGVSLVIRTNADYLLTDLILSGLDGLGVLDRLANAGVLTEIVVYSAINREEVVETCMSKGAVFYITKPCSPEILVSRMKDLFLTASFIPSRKYE